jgi:tetratricopeptide (TPR) repeat protein
MSFLGRMRLRQLLWKLPVVGLLGVTPAAVVSQPAPAPGASETERTFQAAMAAEDRGDLDQAQTLLSRLHADHPGLFAVDESLGLLLVSRNQVSSALPLLEAAAREQPSSDAAHVNLGAALYQLHRNQEALAEFERAVRLNPGNLAAQQSLGRIAMETQRPAEAVKALLAAQRLKPDDPDLRLDCVTALLAARRVPEAQAMLAAFAGADQSARAQSLLGEIAEKDGKFEDAGAHFARAVELEPDEDNAWQLACDLLRHWAFDAAVAELQAASAKFPASKRLRLGLGAALFGDAHYAEAIPVFADLLAGDPANATYAGLLGIACNAPMQAANPRCTALVAFAQAHPEDAGTALSAATLLWTASENGGQSGPNTDLARTLLARAIAIDPGLADAQLEMGVVLQDESDWKGSIPYLERAIQLDPGLSQAHYRLARAYWRVGRKQEADAQMKLEKSSALEQQEDLHRRLSQITALTVNVQP